MMKKAVFLLLLTVLAFKPVMADETELPSLPAPVISIEEEDIKVIISASGEGRVHLFINGQEVNNPYSCYRSYDEIFLHIEATATAEGWESGYTSMDYVVIPRPIPFLEYTTAPTIAGRSVAKCHVVTISETEPSVIYYRVGTCDESTGGYNFGEWMEYKDMLIFEERGQYRIDAFATANGKLDSEHITYEFEVTPPIPGDVNGDGKLSIQDVTALINMLLSQNW